MDRKFWKGAVVERESMCRETEVVDLVHRAINVTCLARDVVF